MKAAKPQFTNLVYGKNPVDAILAANPERLIRLYTTEKRAELFERFAKKLEIKTSAWFDQLLPEAVHQNVVADLTERTFQDLKYLADSAQDVPSIVLLVDQIFDPHNFGAIMRSAECFGADGIIWSSNKGVGITPTVVKASAGASECLNLIPVKNLSQTCKKLQEYGYWLVAADASEDDQKFSSQLASLNHFEFPQKTVLVMGSESTGVQELILKTADFRVRIPEYGKISSLNVAQATAVLLAEYRRQFS